MGDYARGAVRIGVPVSDAKGVMSSPFEPTGSSFDTATFRQVLGHVPTGVTVIAAQLDNEPVGLAVGTFFSVSLSPPMVGFCVAETSTSFPKVQQAGKFCASVLSDDQEAVSRIFASSGADKFRGLGWRPASDTGSPMLTDALAWIDCSIGAVHAAGDHLVVIGNVHHLEVARDAAPLVFYRGGYRTLGD